MMKRLRHRDEAHGAMLPRRRPPGRAWHAGRRRVPCSPTSGASCSVRARLSGSPPKRTKVCPGPMCQSAAPRSAACPAPGRLRRRSGLPSCAPAAGRQMPPARRRPTPHTVAARCVRAGGAATEVVEDGKCRIVGQQRPLRTGRGASPRTAAQASRAAAGSVRWASTVYSPKLFVGTRHPHALSLQMAADPAASGGESASLCRMCRRCAGGDEPR